MAGVADPWKLNEAKSAAEACEMIGVPQYSAGVTYARVFAEADGRGSVEDAAYTALVKSMSAGEASSVRAICWFLYWGSFTGNTLNGILGRKEGKDTGILFKIFMLVFYGPLFALIALVSFLVSMSPTVPAWFGALFGAILACVAGIWFCPIGFIAMALCTQASNAKSA